MFPVAFGENGQPPRPPIDASRTDAPPASAAHADAAGGLLTRRHLASARPHAIALGTSLVAAIAVTPAGVAQAPSDLPGWKTFGSIAVLGTVCTAVAYLVFFTIIARAGAGYAALVTYLVPPVALGYGAVFLDEGVGASALIGLALILAGVTLGTRRAVRAPRPATAPA